MNMDLTTQRGIFMAGWNAAARYNHPIDSTDWAERELAYGKWLESGK